MPNFGKSNASGNVSTFSTARGMVGTFHAVSDAILESISIRKQGGEGRIALFAGGSLADPTNSTLVEQWVIPAGGDSSFVEQRLASLSNSGIVSSSIVWILTKTDGIWGVDVSLDPGDKGDWANARYQSAVVSGDPSIPFPSTWPSDSGSFGSTYISTFFTYSTGGGGPPANVPPSADFTFAVDINTVTFDPDSSTDSDGTIEEYLWNFGDGTTSTSRYPVHEFAPGSYEVTLTVTDDDGAEHTSDPQTVTTEELLEFTVVRIRGAGRSGVSNAKNVLRPFS
jgi:hypothetical protein